MKHIKLRDSSRKHLKKYIERERGFYANHKWFDENTEKFHCNGNK